MEHGRTFENGYKATEEYPEYIDHYFYFSELSNAEEAAERLRERGWQTQVGPAAIGADWLALATQPATGDEDMEDIYLELTGFASRLGGVYDGWERPMTEEDYLM
jgi:hypothetical protein